MDFPVIMLYFFNSNCQLWIQVFLISLIKVLFQSQRREGEQGRDFIYIRERKTKRETEIIILKKREIVLKS